jgi:acyl-[acyl-carrier-protein]-phospholipid O-acyltransferase/long-chain-fatty-acid--[acyl-carrier-protein] ligase
MRSFLRVLLRVLFRFRAFNEAVLQTPGPVLLIPNHISWLDWLFIGVCLDEDWRFVTSSATAQTNWLFRKLMINRRTFPIDTNSPYAAKRMAEFLEGGGRLVLFAEGRISPTGALMKFYDGTGFLLHKTTAKVITAYLRGANRLRWVRHPGWTRWFPRVTAHFGEVLAPPKVEHASATQARNKLTSWLRDRVLAQRFAVEMEHGPSNLLAAIAETARQRPRFVVLEDLTRQQLKYRRLMVGSELLARQWQRMFGGAAGERIGVLMPNVNATPVLLLSLWAANKVPAVLNFSTGPATMLACVQLAGLKQIITSRVFLDRAKLSAEPFEKAGVQMTYLEDVRQSIGGGAKLVTLFRHALMPQSALRIPHLPGDSPAVILFTSGSEGTPKGVELTHTNVLANIRQAVAMIDLQDSDRIFNALPMFHSFGLTVGTLLPLVTGNYVFFYPSPLHYRIVPVAVYDRCCTIMLGTNTFLNGYARKAHPYDFRSVRLLFAGAEKVQEATATLWARRFGIRILEGYGATECSPAITLNTPMENCFGSAGRFLPGIEWRLEPVEGVSEPRPAGVPARGSSEGAAPIGSPPDREPGERAAGGDARGPHSAVSAGRLFVRGPNVMRGYLNLDANSAFKKLGGWYDTGDIVRVDGDGFVHILGRLKRFAKVSGEMVSLTAVEDALAGAFPHYGLRCQVAILSRPDEDKGEALIAVTNEPKLQLDEIRAALRAKGFTNLCVPRAVKFVREIPKLGTGKVNHRELAAMLGERNAEREPETRRKR